MLQEGSRKGSPTQLWHYLKSKQVCSYVGGNHQATARWQVFRVPRVCYFKLLVNSISIPKKHLFSIDIRHMYCNLIPILKVGMLLCRTQDEQHETQVVLNSNFMIPDFPHDISEIVPIGQLSRDRATSGCNKKFNRANLILMYYD